MNDFRRDDLFQREMRDEHIEPFYRHISGGQYVFLDPKAKNDDSCAWYCQSCFGVDTFIRVNGDALGMEEKIVRWPKTDRAHERYAIETDSCTVPGYEKRGWIDYTVADRLLYGFMQRSGGMIAHIIPMRPLVEWCYDKVEGDVYRMDTYHAHTMENKNRSRVRLVDIADVWRDIPGCRAWYLKSGEFKQWADPLTQE